MLRDSVPNQPPPLENYNPWQADPCVRSAVSRADAEWIDSDASSLAEKTGSAEWLERASAANRHVPELRTHNRYGERTDEVDFHPAYHELMSLAFGSGLH